MKTKTNNSEKISTYHKYSCKKLDVVAYRYINTRAEKAERDRASRGLLSRQSSLLGNIRQNESSCVK